MSRAYVNDRKKPGRHLGTWTLPSGNVLNVYVWMQRDGCEGQAYLRWEDDISVEDRWHYEEEIEPEIARRIRRLLEMSPNGKLFLGPVEVER